MRAAFIAAHAPTRNCPLPSYPVAATATDIDGAHSLLPTSSVHATVGKLPLSRASTVPPITLVTCLLQPVKSEYYCHQTPLEPEVQCGSRFGHALKRWKVGDFESTEMC
jgi:hypothetical protein